MLRIKRTTSFMPLTNAIQNTLNMRIIKDFRYKGLELMHDYFEQMIMIMIFSMHIYISFDIIYATDFICLVVIISIHLIGRGVHSIHDISNSNYNKVCHITLVNLKKQLLHKEYHINIFQQPFRILKWITKFDIYKTKRS